MPKVDCDKCDCYQRQRCELARDFMNKRYCPKYQSYYLENGELVSNDVHAIIGEGWDG